MRIPNRNRAINDLRGKVFGDLTVLQYAGSLYGNAHWKCKCKCGNMKTVIAGHLVNGHTKSCGCLSRRTVAARNRTHGATVRGQKWREYNVWKAMINRCTNQKCKGFASYGGRGIKVCDRWLNSFEDFLSDLGGRFPDGMTVERIDVDGDYSPSNCRLATAAEQSRNKRNSRRMTYQGRTMCAADWAKELGMKPGTIYVRLNELGWSVERTLSTPPKRGRNQHSR